MDSHLVAVFRRPLGLTTDPSGNVYVADSGRGEVQKFDENGGHLATWSIPGARLLAADTHGHVYVLSTLFVSSVIDVRSYSGTDEGAWSATLPGTWFNYTGYQPASISSPRTMTTDAAGNVVLSGVSGQRLEGAGPDCSSVFSLHPEDEFEYANPLETGEVARFSRTGGVLDYGWLSRSSQACYPGWYSDGVPLGVAVAPDDGSIWVAQGEHFFRRVLDTGSSINQDALLEVPCLACLNPPGENYSILGPEAFGCQGNLYVGAGDRILEYYNGYPISCPSPPSSFSLLSAEVALAPAIVIKKHGKTKTLSFDAGCLGHGCTIAMQAEVRRPGCHGGDCLVLLGHAHFKLSGGRRHTLSLTLSHAGAILLGRDPGIGVALSARMLKRGRAFGPTFRPAGGKPLIALSPVALSLTCPAAGAVSVPLVAVGHLSIGGVTHVTVMTGSPSGATASHVVAIGAGGAFSAMVVPDRPGTWTFTASFAGDRLHAPAGASCATGLPGPPAGPVRLPPKPKPPPPPPPPPPPTPTSLTLECPEPAGPGGFTGMLTPALLGVSVTITYKFENQHHEQQEKKDTVVTTATGSYEDHGRPEGGEAGVHDTATASWPGGAGYAGSSSPTCEFVY